MRRPRMPAPMMTIGRDLEGWVIVVFVVHIVFIVYWIMRYSKDGYKIDRYDLRA